MGIIELKRVTVNFMHTTDFNKLESLEIICDDDLDKYDIMTHCEDMCIYGGWIITGVVETRGSLKIYEIN